MILFLQNIAPTHFEQPRWLLLLIPLVVLIIIQLGRSMRLFPHIRFSNTTVFSRIKASGKASLLPVMYSLRHVALLSLIVALARPASHLSSENINVEGIDIVIVTDISASMLAQDFSPNRIEAAKDVAANFINSRVNDRIGLVLFAGNTYTLCPLTGDKAALLNLLKEIKIGMIERTSTAIGDGIATGINRLKESESVSKVIILLTDGENNDGNIDPVQAAEIAKMLGIRVYTIGVGSRGMARAPVQIINGRYIYDYVEVRIDEEVLTKAAEMTGGNYFRATNKTKLEEIYEEINNLEKTKLNVIHYQSSKPLYYLFLYLALFFLITEFLFRTLILKTIP
ncbi:MAG: VWA domain-containing protein [Bacteroidales bacterium]|nr:VWA domain-containing protein [Bacteroidales bacterium]